MYKKDNRIVATLDAGGTNFVFGAMKAGEFIIDPISVPSQAHDLDLCLQNMVNGFRQVFDKLEEKDGIWTRHHKDEDGSPLEDVQSWLLASRSRQRALARR